MYFGYWLGSNQYHQIFKEQQIYISNLEDENRDLALIEVEMKTNIRYRFSTCQNILDKLGLMDQYKMSMGGEE